MTIKERDENARKEKTRIIEVRLNTKQNRNYAKKGGRIRAKELRKKGKFENITKKKDKPNKYT